MRTIINSLTIKNSTKSERRFLELLKKNHIPFKSKVKIGGREIDFLIGKYAIDIDCHPQDVSKNLMLLNQGYTPIHFNNRDVGETLEKWIKQTCQEQIYLPM